MIRNFFTAEFIGETITSVDMFSTKDDLEIHFYHLDHLHNAYIAAGTLASACVIVALIVSKKKKLLVLVVSSVLFLS